MFICVDDFVGVFFFVVVYSVILFLVSFFGVCWDIYLI